jgi:hypothetical protein
MNKPFQPRDGLSPLPDVWGKLRIIAEMKHNPAEAMKLFADLRAGHPYPFKPLTDRLNPILRQLNADAQFDADRERDEQGKPMGESLWP